MSKLVFSDIDGTLFRSSLLISLVEELVMRGHFPNEAKDEYIADRQKWIERRDSYHVYIAAVINTFKHHLKGVHYKDYLKAADAVVAREKDYVYVYTRELLAKLKREGYTLVAISHSPKTILDPFCSHYNFDRVYGSLYELGPQDRFTGNMLDEHIILNKANVVKRVLEKEGWTLEDSVGIGDTENDIAMLELVSHPICFNPTKSLYKHAKRMDWEVVVERKDMVYTL